MKAILAWIFLAAAIIAALALGFLHSGVSSTAIYVTSESCKDCHPVNYGSWSGTLHPKMFRPVKSDSDILGDFSKSDPAVTFTKKDVEYVVGNKWEQVYARIIDGEYYPLPAKWHVIQKRWVPFKMKDHKEIPMSKKCNGCHTTGFDPATLRFAEFGIGCEACHGPGSLHVQNRRRAGSGWCSPCHGGQAPVAGDIVVSVSSSVCGQCHNRGVNNGTGGAQAGEFSFPVRYQPGEEINNSFTAVKPGQDPKGAFWWGSGIAKNRHQEFSDWGKSNHASANTLLLSKYIPGTTRGKLSDECLRCHCADYRLAREGKRPTLKSARFGVTCVVCHEPHGKTRAGSVSGDAPDRCGGCHADSISAISAKKGRPHTPCPPGAAGCPDCHMPRVVETGGYFSLRSHAFKVIPPGKAEKGMPNSCQNGGCHADKPLSWAVAAFAVHYPEPAQ